MRVTSDDLKELRHLRKWTQAQAADALGVTRGTWNAWERGREVPTPARVRRIIHLIKTERARGEPVGEAEVLRRELLGFAQIVGVEKLRELHREAENLARSELGERA